MAKAKPLSIGVNNFPTMTAATQYYQEILHSINKGVLDRKHFDDMRALIERHVDAETKIGSGIKDFAVGGDSYAGKCFYLLRTDGSFTDFSFTKCIKSKKVSNRDKFNRAARSAIFYQIIDYKKDYFYIHPNRPCEQTGEMVTYETCHVDHCGEFSFKSIVDNFIREHNIDVESVKTYQRNQVEYFDDKELEYDFQNYHDTYAKLQVVTPNYNLTKGKF